MGKVSRDWCPEAIAFLRAEVDLGPDHDTRIARVYAALDYLETRLGSTWSIVTFRRSLEIGEPLVRWRNASAALSEIADNVSATPHRTLTHGPA